MASLFKQRAWLSLPLVLVAAGCGSEPPDSAAEAAPDPAEIVTAVADDYYAHALSTSPEIAYFAGIELERHDGLSDNSPEALAANDAVIDDLLARLSEVDADELVGKTAWITHALLLEELEGDVGLRVCRNEVWNVNQMGGWHSG